MAIEFPEPEINPQDLPAPPELGEIPIPPPMAALEIPDLEAEPFISDYERAVAAEQAAFDARFIPEDESAYDHQPEPINLLPPAEHLFPADAPGGDDGFQLLGFNVSAVNDDAGPDGVTVYPSLVTGLDPLGIIPKIGATPIDTDPPPLFTFTGEKIISIRIEITPQILEPDPGEYIWGESFTLVGDLIITDDQSDAQPALMAGGAVTQNGIYHIPLARALEDAGTYSRIVQYQYGPISVCFAADYSALAQSPPVFIHTGTLETFE